MAEEELTQEVEETGEEVEETTEAETEGKPEVDWKKLARKHEREAKKNKAAAEELAEIKERQKDEVAKLKASEAKAREEAELLKAEQTKRAWADEVAEATGFNAALLMRIQAESKEELLEVAKKFVQETRSTGLPFVENEGKHPTKTPKAISGNDWLRQAIKNN